MNRAVILSGSNEGGLLKNLENAIDLISRQIGVVSKTSSVYETEPWGNTNQPVFNNQVIEVLTPLSAQSLMKTLLHIEKEMGRERKVKWAPRIIDLDILYYNNDIIQEEKLVIPHPHLHERRFTLVPLTELFPDMMHPVLKLRNKDLLAELKDNMMVKAINIGLPVK